MSKYFKLVGIIELIGFAIGVIFYFVEMVSAIKSLTAYGGGDSWTILMWIVGLFAIMIVGPAVGLLFYNFGKMMEI